DLDEKVRVGEAGDPQARNHGRIGPLAPPCPPRGKAGAQICAWRKVDPYSHKGSSPPPSASSRDGAEVRLSPERAGVPQTALRRLGLLYQRLDVRLIASRRDSGLESQRDCSAGADRRCDVAAQVAVCENVIEVAQTLLHLFQPVDQQHA